ncbi:hypothetical protein [Zongyangia hominis]|uniref:Uncharacterized protein n=1 Tax=Zongyangia hominis TaxID=2763677 RepID=A0A926IA70_9FIRM|nr:hypothetical protein [Zongyangia hominis]MBC8569911.1 hypothetical protein [Zongyangia hominis]
MLDNSIAYVASSHYDHAATEGDGGGNRPTRTSKIRLSEEDVVALASLLALSLGKDKTHRDLETLINLLSLVTANLRSMLTQRSVNRGATIEIIE